MIFRANYGLQAKVRPGLTRELAPVQKSTKNASKQTFRYLDHGLPIANLRYHIKKKVFQQLFD